MKVIAELEEALSLERFNRYLEWAEGDRARAVELYTLNAKISERLYLPLHTLEVALRNRIHAVMTEAHHENWFRDDIIILIEKQRDQIISANEAIEREKKPITAGRIVAALTFSFWTSMFGNDYENLWQTTLHKIGKRPDGKGFRRKEFSSPLTPIRVLRNRIAHHEPIITWDLPKHYNRMVQITEWLSKPAAEWCQIHCSFSDVYPKEGITLYKNG